MERNNAEKINNLAKEIAKLLKEEIPYTTVMITDSEIRITEDLYGFSVK